MEKKYLKPSEYAKITGIHYRTAIRWFHQGKLEGISENNHVYILNPKYTEEIKREHEGNRVILYARVSSSQNKKSLDGQIERMRIYALARGYQVVGEYKEVASGLNENRPLFSKLLDKQDYDILLVEHKDRLTRFGKSYIEKVLELKSQKLEIINKIEDNQHEMMDDFISIVTSFCQRLYSSNRKKKTKEIIDKITEDNNG